MSGMLASSTLTVRRLIARNWDAKHFYYYHISSKFFAFAIV